jgi:hypothetical protein
LLRRKDRVTVVARDVIASQGGRYRRGPMEITRAKQRPRLYGRPPAWRVLVAFLVAPIIAFVLLPFVSAALDGETLGSLDWRRGLELAPFVLIIGAYLPTLFLGVPMYLVLASRVRPRLLYSVAAGAVVAAAPWFLLYALFSPDYAFSNGHVTHRNGAPTLDGWIDLIKVVARIAIAGGIGGVVFWLIALSGLRPAKTAAH